MPWCLGWDEGGSVYAASTETESSLEAAGWTGSARTGVMGAAGSATGTAGAVKAGYAGAMGAATGTAGA